jgi:uncharacterized protein (TIGR01777 family)
MPNVLISGGSGLVGSHLCRALKEKGYTVSVLSRSKEKHGKYQTYHWDIDHGSIEEKAIDEADYIIHLAGADIFNKTWTPKQRQEIVDSRVKSAKLLFAAVKTSDNKPKAFISASAIGYYGAFTSEVIFLETDPPGDDFLARTCVLWEEAADNFHEIGIRTIKIRTAIVLAKEGGALEKMKRPTDMGLGAALGSGKQYIPWIHIDDLCNIYIKAIEDINMNGAYNAVAPDVKTNKEFMRTLADTLHKPFTFPNVPKFVLKLILGERAKAILEGSRVSPEKIISAGFKFKFPDLASALKNLFPESDQNK